MTTPDAVLGKPRVARAISSWAIQQPELAPALAVLAAWVTLLLAGQRSGMDMGSHHASVWASAAASLPSWMLMTVAMMGPAVLTRFRYVGRASARPVRALAGFAGAYLAVWAAFGFLAQALAAAMPGVPGLAALALTLLAAAAWQLTPVKRHLLRRHKNPVGAPASGTLAGVRYGLCCLGACWCLMLVMVAAPDGQLLWLAGLTVLITAERVVPDQAAAARAAAAALAVAAAATLAVAGLL
jgi:predicted metal-binding membrane protein